MAFCPKCGAQLPEEETKFCPSCGAPVEEEKQTVPTSQPVDSSRIVMGILAYLGPLVFIPLCTKKDDDFLVYHSRQGFTLFVFWVAVAILSVLPIVKWLAWPCEVFLTVISVFGIVNVCRNQKKEVPVLGKIDALKWFKK